MPEPSLFESFARELVGDGSGVAWTQIALLGMWFWDLWIASTGENFLLFILVFYEFVP